MPPARPGCSACRSARATRPPTTGPTTPSSRGNYAPVSEEITADDLRSIGRIPDGLGGMFVRNGPNPQFPPIGDYHWFDGDGMLHGVLLRDGRASYRNRWVRTRGFAEEREAGHAIWGGLNEPPRPDAGRSGACRCSRTRPIPPSSGTTAS